LAARSGLFSAEMNRENLALIADWAQHQKGRTWRSLEDTSISAPILYSARSDWGSRRRGTDFYDEGVLLWLDVDTQIRTLSKGNKSLDDFCHAFFGGKDGPPEVRPYTFADVVKALDNVVAHDWKDFLDKRVKTTAPEAPLAGLHRSGWKMVYKPTASDLFKSRDSDDKTINLTSSIGLLLKEEGQVADVIPGMAADKAGIGPGMKLHLISDRQWSSERLHDAIADTAQGHKLVLVMENQDFSQTYTLDYTEGLRYPHLEHVEGDADLLDKILHPRIQPKAEQK
jgi:predicted metalloprotease with PDZ domain